MTLALPADYQQQVYWANELCKLDDYTAAENFLRKLLNENPSDGYCLFLAAYCARGRQNFGVAKALLKQAFQETENPDWTFYNNMGELCHFLWQHDEAFNYLFQAHEMKPDDAGVMNNIAVAYLYTDQPEKTIEWANKGLQQVEGHVGCLDNLSVAQLMLRDWENGWRNYDVSLGGNYREKFEYNIRDETGEQKVVGWWDGTPGQTLVISGEQGLGDELMFASGIPDLMQNNKVLMECDPKLRGLFKRSLPGAEVYGSRFNRRPIWSTIPTASTSLASMLQHIRKKDEDFPGTPYLIACPKRRIQWRALFEAIGNDVPKIGIAWTGGTQQTGSKDRYLPLELWRPILEQNAHFVNLEYVPRYLEIEKADYQNLHTYEWATLTDDYDDTMALVAELDLVISVPTTIIHAAGGLGVETWCLVNKYPNWRFGPQPESMDGKERLIWTPCVELIRQGKDEEDWQPVVERTAEKLNEWISNDLYRDRSPQRGERMGSNVIDHPARKSADKDGSTIRRTDIL